MSGRTRNGRITVLMQNMLGKEMFERITRSSAAGHKWHIPKFVIDKETLILRLVARNKTYRQIQVIAGCTKKHIARVKAKYDVRREHH